MLTLAEKGPATLLVKSGEFDRLLLRPRSVVFQVAAREIQTPPMVPTLP